MAAKELDDILEQIWKKPGFENFLCAASEESLFLAAEEGPVVVLNVTELRSDAILLTKARVTSIALLCSRTQSYILFYHKYSFVTQRLGLCSIFLILQ